MSLYPADSFTPPEDELTRQGLLVIDLPCPACRELATWRVTRLQWQRSTSFQFNSYEIVCPCEPDGD